MSLVFTLVIIQKLRHSENGIFYRLPHVTLCHFCPILPTLCHSLQIDKLWHEVKNLERKGQKKLVLTYARTHFYAHTHTYKQVLHHHFGKTKEL